MQQDYLGFALELQRQYKDMAYLRIGFNNIFHVIDPELARQLLTQQAAHTIRWEKTSEIFAQSMGQSILVTHGQEWQRQRRLLSSGFSHKKVMGYARHMIDACQDSLQPLSQTSTQRIDIHAFMTDVTLDVIARALFGQAQPIDGRRVSQAIGALSKAGIEQIYRPITLPLWFPIPSLRKAHQAQAYLDQLLEQRIEQQRQELELHSQAVSNEDNLLNMLLLARDPEHPEQGLSPSEVRDQTMAIFQAGHETTATALTWWAGLMAQHPQVVSLVQAEIDAKLGTQLPDAQTMPSLHWLNATLKEAMRLYPPAAILFSRRTLKDITLGQYLIPKGSLVAITPAAIQRNPRWFDNADQFQPQRFMPTAPDIPKGAWMPFGAGPHACLGQHFAMLEMGIIAAMLLQRFELRWPTDQSWPEPEVTITMRPRSAMQIELRRRIA
jgi:cytochrome P450